MFGAMSSRGEWNLIIGYGRSDSDGLVSYNGQIVCYRLVRFCGVGLYVGLHSVHFVRFCGVWSAWHWFSPVSYFTSISQILKPFLIFWKPFSDFETISQIFDTCLIFWKPFSDFQSNCQIFIGLESVPCLLQYLMSLYKQGLGVCNNRSDFVL